MARPWPVNGGSSLDLGTAVLFVAGLAGLIGGAELLVRGASRLAAAAGISPIVIGLTVVAFGTSAPELAVTVGSAATGQADVALGNVVGSNIFNVLLILGVSALLTPLIVAQRLVRLDVPLVIVASVATLLLGLDGRIDRLDGIVLFAGVVAYVLFLVRQSRRESSAIRDEYVDAFGGAPAGRVSWPVNLVLIGAGLVLLVAGAQALVSAAVTTAEALGLSELVIGLTIVAAGTSLPEVATSILASLRGERDIAVGNVVGSNLFNLLAVLGLGSVISPDGVAVATGALTFDIPVMIAVAVAMLPIFFTGYRVSRWEGAVFVGYYVAYTAYLLLRATDHDALPAFEIAMIGFVLPLTALTLAVVLVRALHRGRSKRRATEPTDVP
jgi:cation:H+ antiporter